MSFTKAPQTEPTPLGELEASDLLRRPGSRYALAARDALRQSLPDLLFNGSTAQADRWIQVMPDERPTADCGQIFIGLTYKETPKAGPGYETISVEVLAHITVRTADIPQDLQGVIVHHPEVTRQQSPYVSLPQIVEAVTAVINGNQNVFSATNDSNDLRLLSPLHIQNYGNPRTVGTNHFLGDAERFDAETSDFGVLQTLTFGGGLSHRVLAMATSRLY